MMQEDTPTSQNTQDGEVDAWDHHAALPPELLGVNSPTKRASTWSGWDVTKRFRGSHPHDPQGQFKGSTHVCVVKMQPGTAGGAPTYCNKMLTLHKSGPGGQKETGGGFAVAWSNSVASTHLGDCHPIDNEAGRDAAARKVAREDAKTMQQLKYKSGNEVETPDAAVTPPRQHRGREQDDTHQARVVALGASDVVRVLEDAHLQAGVRVERLQEHAADAPEHARLGKLRGVTGWSRLGRFTMDARAFVGKVPM